jgi:aromatic ring-opening dioxygenase catalytic subunit (LigB family)
VFQLSLKNNLDIVDHLKLGEALQPLRKEDILIVGSGQTTHNLMTPSSCQQFTDWFHDVLTNPAYSAADRKRRLIECHKQPSLPLAHPRIEHFLPSIVVCAAAGYNAGSILYNETVLRSTVISAVKFA